MTATRHAWPHNDIMTWTETVSLRHTGVEDVTQQDYNVTTSVVLLAPDDTPTRWQLGRFLAVVMASLLSNFLVLVTVKRSPRLQSLVYFYMASLAAMDILDSLLVMPVSFARSLLNERRVFSGWCLCWQTVLFCLAAGTWIHIILATLHCYLMLGTSLRYHKYSQSLMQVTFGWALPAILSVPAIVVQVKNHYATESISGWGCPLDTKYMSAALVPLYYIPLVTLIMLLVLFAFKVKHQGHMSDQLQSVLPGLSFSNGYALPRTRNGSKEAVTVKTTEKAMKLPERVHKWKKPVANMESTCTIASEYSQGNSEECCSVSDIHSEDCEDDSSIGKDKEMLIAEVHSSSALGGEPTVVDEHEAELSSSPVCPGCDNSRPNSSSEIGEPDYETDGTNSDYEISYQNSDYERTQENSHMDNTESNRSLEIDSDTNSCQLKAKKTGKEQLNEPLDNTDVQLTLESVDLLDRQCSMAGSDNPAYCQDESGTPLADSIQVKHKENTEDERNIGSQSPDGSCCGSEPGECGIKSARRSILRRDGSRSVSKKVQFAIPENLSNEGKSAKRIRRQPTGLRRRTRNSNMLNALNNGTAKHIVNGNQSNLSLITNGVTAVPHASFEYMMQVHRNQGLKLSRKVRSHQVHFTAFCAMLVVHSILSLPYMFSYTLLTICHSCRSFISGEVVVTLEWMHHVSSCVNLLLFILFNSEFRESLANLCG